MDIADLRQGYMEFKSSRLSDSNSSIPVGGSGDCPTRRLKLERVVRRGDQIVLLAASAGTMEVRMNGTALDDASVGEKVKVKNSSSQRVVEGIVQAPGIVKVTM